MRLVLGTSASQFESEVAYHLYARVVQLADTAVSKTVSSPFESEREYQNKVSTSALQVPGFRFQVSGVRFRVSRTQNESRNPDTRNPKLETRNPKLNSELEPRHSKLFYQAASNAKSRAASFSNLY